MLYRIKTHTHTYYIQIVIEIKFTGNYNSEILPGTCPLN